MNLLSIGQPGADLRRGEEGGLAPFFLFGFDRKQEILQAGLACVFGDMPRCAAYGRHAMQYR